MVEPLTDVVGRFSPGVRLSIKDQSRTRLNLVIESVRPHRGGFLVVFEGHEDRDSVEPLRGLDLEIGSEEIGQAPEGSYFHFELIGCKCMDVCAGYLGEVLSVVEDGGGLLLEIGGGQQSLLVPFVQDYLTGIDRVAKTITLKLPEGLLETCTYRS